MMGKGIGNGRRGGQGGRGQGGRGQGGRGQGGRGQGRGMALKMGWGMGQRGDDRSSDGSERTMQRVEKRMRQERQTPAIDTSQSIHMAVVDIDTCTGCGQCVDVCPRHAIFVDRVAAIDRMLCTGCGACLCVCRHNALSITDVPYSTAQ